MIRQVQDSDSWQDIFRRAADAIDCPVSDRQMELFEVYRTELLRWNKKISLLSLKTPLDLPVKHFVDSLTLLPHLNKRGERDSFRLLDVGTGAGFPGLPLKIMNDVLDVTLVDSSRKKTSFLKQVLRALNLKGVTVRHDRIERILEEEPNRGTFDYVVSRATFSLAELIRGTHLFLSPGGVLIGMKGMPREEELRAAGEAASLLDIELIGRHDVTLPLAGGTRTLFLYRRDAGSLP